MNITDGEFILLVLVFSLLATIWVTTRETEYEEVIEQKALVEEKHVFHSESFNEMRKGDTYKW